MQSLLFGYWQWSDVAALSIFSVPWLGWLGIAARRKDESPVDRKWRDFRDRFVRALVVACTGSIQPRGRERRHNESADLVGNDRRGKRKPTHE